MKFQQSLASSALFFTFLVTAHAQPASQESSRVEDFRKGLEAKLSAGKSAEAIALFTEALKKAKKQEKPALREEFLRSMARSGKPLEAYRSFPGGKEAFAVLAEQLVGSGHDRLLAELVAEHAVFFDDDPFVDLYRGQAAFAAGKFAEADAHWTAAFCAIDNDYLTELFQRRRAEARFRIGKIVDAYAEDVKSFRILADLCLANRKHAELEKLLEAHLKRNSPDSTVVDYRFAMQPSADFATLQKISLSTLKEGLGVDYANRLVFSHMAAQGRALEAYKAAPDPRAAFAVLARRLADERSLADLRRLIDLHRKTAADDSQIADVEVRMLVETNELEKAIALMKKSLANDALAQAKKESKARTRWTAEFNYLHAAYLRGGALTAYEELGRREFDFTTVAQMYTEDRDVKGLAALLTVRPAERTAEKGIWKYESRLKILMGKTDEAVAIFVDRPREPPPGLGGKGGAKGGLGKLFFGMNERKPAEGSAIREEIDFVLDMADLGHGLTAYRAVNHPGDVFFTLADHYRWQQDAAGLAQLLEEHRTRKPGDPDLSIFTGCLALMRGQPRVAEEIFRSELARRAAKPSEKTEAFSFRFESAARKYLPRNELALALVRQGRAVEQYRIAGSDDDAFARVAAICVAQKDSAQLEALLAVHRRNHANDASLCHYQAELAFLTSDYDAALNGFKRNADDDAGIIYQYAKYPFYRPRDKYLVSLVRLKRFDEAVRLAEDWEKNAPSRNPIVQVLPYAAAGNVEQTMRLMQIHGKRRANLVAFYGNEDLGPLLRGEAMRTVRERFPEPVQ